jgi:hypothetical protein
MKLQLETYQKKYTIESEFDDLSIEDYLYLYRGLLISAGFNPTSIKEYIIELADELKEE